MTRCLIRHYFFSILFCAISLIASQESSAQAVKGAIRGQVQDAEFYVSLPGVTITLDGGSQTASVVSDADGNYFINDLEPGSYNLTASGEGFVRERISGIVVTPGAVKEAAVGLTSVVVELDEFVVSAEGLIDAQTSSEPLALRTELKSFTDVLGAKFISQTGASDAAKLLAKTTGVNVSDGKFVVVRGLADRYNSVTLNGLRVPSSDPDRRAVALDLFPSSVIQDIRTSKTFLPDLPGEATGANIDVKTKSVPTEDFVKLKIGSGYNSQSTGNRNYLTYNGGGTGVLGTADDRALPGFIKNSTLADLPDGVFSPTLNARRQAVNQALSQELGTKEKEAPMDFSLEASLGHRTEFMGAPTGITVAIDYSKKYSYSDKDSLGRYLFNANGANAGLVQSVSRVVVPPDQIDDIVNANLGGNSAYPSSGILPYGMRVGQETMRAGMLVSAGFQPSDHDEVTMTYFFNRIAEDRANLQFGFKPDDPDTSPYRESLTYTERQIRTWQLAGEHHVFGNTADMKVNWALSYNQSSQLEPDQRFIAQNYDLGDNFGQYSFPIQNQPFVQRVWRELFDESYSARMDIETDLFGNSLPEDLTAKVRFGGLLDYTDRTYRAD
ncbi:MAG: carboxypeptidase regulatory-like domain-containing protein, partial [Prosthecobacter sp.]|nr:carboxypeptidase regulatory-like domain-containing protein [Prosthecobacter sp.]